MDALKSTLPAQPAHFSIPTHLVSDYIEIGYLSLALIFGAILNLAAFRLLVGQFMRRHSERPSPLKYAFMMLKLHLNISNLLTLLVYCPTAAGWLISYRWMAGDLMCRLVQFLWLFSFHLNSNIVASIAIDRLRNVLRMLLLNQNSNRLPAHQDSNPLLCVKVLI